jgi:hypothetical protein
VGGGGFLDAIEEGLYHGDLVRLYRESFEVISTFKDESEICQGPQPHESNSTDSRGAEALGHATRTSAYMDMATAHKESDDPQPRFQSSVETQWSPQKDNGLSSPWWVQDP